VTLLDPVRFPGAVKVLLLLLLLLLWSHMWTL
jgi:hypothetical protein